MKKKDHVILGVHITDRVKEAQAVQRVFTRHGKAIQTRLGLHEADGKRESPGGIVLLELAGGQKPAKALAAALGKIRGVHVDCMVFGHE